MTDIVGTSYNDRYKLLLSSVNSEGWPILFGEGLYDTFDEIISGESNVDKKIETLLNIYSPDEILSNHNKRRVLFNSVNEKMAREIAVLLGLNSDDFVEIYQYILNIKFNKKEKDVIYNYFGIMVQKSELLEEIPSVITVEPSKPLREYQRVVVSDVLSVFKKHRRCLIHMPTGSGKTTTAMDIVCRILNDNDPTMIIWLAYSQELCEQATYSFKNIWGSKGNRSVSIYNQYGTSDVDFPKDKMDGVVVCTLSKLDSLSRKDSTFLSRFSKNFSMLIFDEAHQAVAPTYEHIVKQIILNNLECKFIGLTATPGRTWDDLDEDRRLSDFFENKIVSIRTESGESPMEYLTRKGILSKLKWIPINYEGHISKKEIEIIEELRYDEDIPLKILDELSLDSKRNLRIMECLLSLIDGGNKRILVFAASVEHSKILSALFKQLGFNSHTIGYDTNKDLRRKIIDDFRKESDDVMIICNYNVLSTGVDIPNIDSGIIARPTKSVVLFSQMVGRMMRGPYNKGGTEIANIATVVDINLPGFKDTYELWMDVWK